MGAGQGWARLTGQEGGGRRVRGERGCGGAAAAEAQFTTRGRGREREREGRGCERKTATQNRERTRPGSLGAARKGLFQPNTSLETSNIKRRLDAVCADVDRAKRLQLTCCRRTELSDGFNLTYDIWTPSSWTPSLPPSRVQTDFSQPLSEERKRS